MFQIYTAASKVRHESVAQGVEVRHSISAILVGDAVPSIPRLQKAQWQTDGLPEAAWPCNTGATTATEMHRRTADLTLERTAGDNEPENFSGRLGLESSEASTRARGCLPFPQEPRFVRTR